MPDHSIRSVMAVESKDEYDLFQLYWEEELGLTPADLTPQDKELLSSWSRAEVESKLECLREWRRQESDRWLRYETEIGEIETKSPWEYLEAVADRYENVRLEDWYMLYFEGEDGPIVTPELTQAMLSRGAAIVEVTGSRVVFSRLDQTGQEWGNEAQ